VHRVATQQRRENSVAGCMVELRTTDDTTAKTRITHKVLPRRVRSWPHNNNGAPGGLVRAATATRGQGGRFVAGKATPAQKELLQHQRDVDRNFDDDNRD